MKVILATGHSFDGLPAHVVVTGKGKGFNLRVAATRAVDEMLSSPELRNKRIGEFKVSFVVTQEEPK